MNDTSGEHEWIVRAQKGDEKALNALIQSHQKAVYALCLRYMRGAEAQDVAQESFLKLFLNLESFDVTKPLLPWLLTIARHTCLDRLRAGKRHTQTASLDHEENAPLLNQFATFDTAERQLTRKQLCLRVEQALANMAEGPREALVLQGVHGLSYQQVAETLGVPMGTVMTWIHRGRAQLQRFITEVKFDTQE